jgi:hypothetical protein
VAALVAVCALLAAALAATALADTQRLPLGKGALSGPKGTWEAIGVPPGSILIDYSSGGASQSYGKSFGTVPARGIQAYGFRPGGLPSRHGLLAGATGKQVRKVRIHLRGGAKRTLRTTAAPAEWGTSNRLFALGFTVASRDARALRAVAKIEALSASGRLLGTLRKVPTGAY